MTYYLSIKQIPKITSAICVVILNLRLETRYREKHDINSTLIAKGVGSTFHLLVGQNDCFNFYITDFPFLNNIPVFLTKTFLFYAKYIW